MTQFNINNIIRDYNLDVNEIAEVLFAEAKHPKLALNRILKGEAHLSVEQLEKLASFIGVMPSSLFELDSWKDATENGYLGFKKGIFKAKLNYNNTFLTLYKNNEVVSEIVLNTQGMTVAQFIEYLDNLILNHQNGTN